MGSAPGRDREGDTDRTGSTHPQGVPGWAETRNGTKLFYQALDGPEPTVVFEAGLASTRSIWGLVQPNLGGVARSVVYDRAGLGRSPRTAGPRRLVNLAEDMSDLLDHLEANVGSAGGFVLVGHSWGGPIVRLAAVSRPTRVRGIVLVEPADEDCEIYYSLTERSNRIQNAVFPPLAHIGLLRRAYGLTVRSLPPAVRTDARREMYTPAAVATQIAESRSMTADLRALQSRQLDLPDVPVIVISGAKSAGVGARARRLMIAAHRARAERAHHGKHVIAEGSGHVVMLSEPEVVVREIQHLLTDVQ